ncbi:SAV_915 family protein [Streptomyces sp. NPDC001927]
MSDTTYAEDPEPSEPVPAGPLFVPVRSGPAGCSARLFRTPLGRRTAVGFTTRAKLCATLGADHACIRLSEPALRALTAPLGVTDLTVDPPSSAPAHTRAPAPARAHAPTQAPGQPAWRRDPRRVGLLRVAIAGAVVSCVSCVNLLIG